MDCRYNPTEQVIMAEARASLAVMHSLLEYGNKAHFDPGKRARVALSLLSAARDHANASVSLVANYAGGLGGSAAALLRLQVEALVKGIYFSEQSATSDAEIDRFTGSGELPTLWQAPTQARTSCCGRRQKRKRRTVTFADMERVALASLEKLKPGLVPSGISSVPMNDLHSLVHAGLAVLDLYRPRNGEIRQTVAPQKLVEVVRNATWLCALAWMFSLIRHGVAESLPVNTADIDASWNQFDGAVRTTDSHLKAAGALAATHGDVVNTDAAPAR